MIVSASYRTDIPAFHADWFEARLRAGFADVRNPRGGPPFRVSLRPGEVDGLVFWTRNIDPFGAALEAVGTAGVPWVVQFTVTGYPRPLETSVIDPVRAADQIRDLADRHGPRAVVWRYDPLLDTALTPPAWQVDNFARMAALLAGAVDEVVLSWATVYRKTRRNLDAAARRHGFAWRDPEDGEKRALLARLVAVARESGLTPTLCAQPELLVPGLAPARCIDAVRLSDVAGRTIPARRKGNRPGCHCALSRDIGAYDTCPHGCVYCYAVSSRDRARRNLRASARSARSAPALAAAPAGPPPAVP